jgi:hypothetical protein
LSHVAFYVAPAFNVQASSQHVILDQSWKRNRMRYVYVWKYKYVEVSDKSFDVVRVLEILLQLFTATYIDPKYIPM